MNTPYIKRRKERVNAWVDSRLVALLAVLHESPLAPIHLLPRGLMRTRKTIHICAVRELADGTDRERKPEEIRSNV